jgi:putative membrane protein
MIPLLILLLCLGGSVFSTLILSLTLTGLLNGLVLGTSFFIASLTADYIISMDLMNDDTIFDFRRTMAVSLFCWVIWLFFMLLGAAISSLVSNPTWWIRFTLLGFSATLILRLVVFNAVSMRSQRRLLVASVLQPILNIVPFLVLSANFGYSITLGTLSFLVASFVIAFSASLGFLFLLNQTGKERVGLKSMPLFKAFMVNWVAGLNAPMEEILQELGEDQEVEVSLMRFGCSETKAIMVVPSIHPGPFKNIGSSILPALLKDHLEKEFGGVTCVPHGMMGHEFDLASQLDNTKVISAVSSCLSCLDAGISKASPFVTVSDGLATASCQVFGRSAFISFTLAPRTIEDLPLELGTFVRDEAHKRGLDLCAIVNAHNSFNRTAEMQESLASLKEVAARCLDKAISQEQFSFDIGVSSILPKEFTLEDGMGSGGITVMVVKSEIQKAAYVVIDGNNMVSGLREQILSSLRSIGIDEGEIFTTDTHAVSAIIKGDRGYHPVGETMENKVLIDHIREVAVSALSNCQRVEVSCRSVKIPHVKVIGASQVETMSLLIPQTIQRAKRMVVPIFGGAGLLLMLLLMFT